MKRLLTIVVTLILSVGLGAISFAQDAGPQGGQLQGKRPRRPAQGIRLMERFQKETLDSLNLTADQKRQIDDLNKDLQDKVKTIVEQNKGTTGNKNIGAQRRTVMKDYNDKLENILGPDLWRQYREGMLSRMKEAREKRKERKDQPAGKGTPPNF